MSAFRRAAVIAGYEWKRALAKKKVLALVILAVLFETLPFILLTQVAPVFMTDEVKVTMWVFGALSGQSMFIQLVAMIIAGGSMAEEYEQGTADIMLSKPIKRVEYMAGKFLGGFLLLVFVEAIMVVLGIVFAFAFFGPQRDLMLVPFIYLAIVYSTLVFFSLAFMLGEVFRRSTLSVMTAFGILIVSSIASSSLSFLYMQSSNQFYLDAGRCLPTWSATSFPSLLVSDLIGWKQNPFLMVTGTGNLFPRTSGDIQLAAIMIGVYAVVFTLVATVRVVKSDVTKKAV